MHPEKKSRNHLRHLIDATGYSLKGLAEAWRHEKAFQQEVALVALLLPVAFWLGRTAVERGMLILSLLLIPAVELLNSAIEAAVDRIGTERHPLSGQAKNMGSAAVMIALIAAALTWGLVAWERFK
ncbi:MAG: diacylglycerol kinase [Desulfatitalea sp.]